MNMDWIHNPEYWVLVAFLIFLAMIWRAGVPGQITKALDGRADAIRNELDEARRLREEAQQLLADYQKEQRDAETEAKAIIDTAKREAEVMAADSRKSLAEQLERRTRLAEEKIARAEAQAVGEVRSAAVDAALAASHKILAGKAAGATGASLIDESIAALKTKLN
jgi:F-type H+-transporting ATPase subunit b